MTTPGTPRPEGFVAPRSPSPEPAPLRAVRPILSRLEIGGGPAQIAAGVGLAGIAILARLLLTPVLGDPVPFLLYFPAIVIAASIGGYRTGLVTVAACALGEAIVFQAATGVAFFSDAAETLRLFLFAVNGIVISLITGATSAARRTATLSRGVAEERYESEARAREDIEQSSRRTLTLYETAAALSDAVTPEEVADVIIRQGVMALGAHVGVVRQLDEDRAALVVLRARGYKQETSSHFETIRVDADTPSAQVMRSGRAGYWTSRQELAADFPATAAVAAANDIEAVAVVPLGIEDRPTGTLLLAFPDRRAFGADERDFIAALGHECAQALERARLYRAEQDARRAAEAGGEAERLVRAEADDSRRALALLADVSELLTSTLEYEATLQEVADRIVMTLADRAKIDLVQPDGSVRTVASARADDASARQAPVESSVSVAMRGSQATLGEITLGSATPDRYGPRETAIVADIARRAAAAVEHAQLYREARQFIATVDATLDAVFMFEPTTLRFTYVNQGAIAQVGLERSELLAMRAIDIKPDFDETRYRQLLAPLIDGSRASITFSTVHRHRTGFDIPVEVFLQCVRLPGGEARMIITSRDIRSQIDVQASLYRLARSERARAAELNAVIQGMSEGVLVCDTEGRVVLANQASTTILGESVDGYRELVERLDPGEGALPALGTSAPPVEVRVRGQERWLEVTSARVASESNDPKAPGESTILVLRDVTAARQSQAAREAFIGVLSHELRTPITTIYGNTKLIRRVKDPAKHEDMLTDIEVEADRLYRLVEDLLILSRAETGLRIDGEPVLLQHLVQSVLDSERPRWPNTTFVVDLPARLPSVTADRTHLEQVVRNLVTNAAKYGAVGGTVTITADNVDGALAVRVIDDGDGVLAGEEERVFQLFYRSPSTSRKAAGAGIGLYVCRVLVEAMGGRIWARPRSDELPEFGFTVPLLTGETVPGDEHEMVT